MVIVIQSPNGRHIISGSNDGAIRIWDAQIGQSMAADYDAAIESVILFSDSRHVSSGANDNIVKLCNADASQNVIDPLVYDDWVSYDNHANAAQLFTSDGIVQTHYHELDPST